MGGGRPPFSGLGRIGSCGPAIFLQVLHIQKRNTTASGLDAVVDINRQVRTAVREAILQGLCPVVLAGNCNSCLGILAGEMNPRAPVSSGWMRVPTQHTETSLVGFLDGMAAAAAVGHCHYELLERIGVEGAVSEDDVLLLGWRDLDPGAHSIDGLASHSATRKRPRRHRGAAARAGPTRQGRIPAHRYRLDPAESPGVDCRLPGGVALARAEALVATYRSLPLAAIALTNHNPDHDPSGLTAAAGLRLLNAIAQRALLPGPH